MYSILSASKIEELIHMREMGVFDSSVIYELLETIHQHNRSLYIQKHKNKFDFGTFRKTSEAVVAKQYDSMIKDWKVFNKEYFNTSLNMLPNDLEDDFIYLDKALSNAVVCNKIIKLHQLTGGNPVQVNLQEAQAYDFIVREAKILEEFMYDYRVVSDEE